MTPGRMSGNVTLRKVVSSLAPRSIAASSRWVGKPASRARTVTTTKLMLNMMWAIRIVTPLSGKNGGAPIATNRVRSEAPRTISGVAIGRKMNRLVALRPAKSWRTMASAMAVPRAVATRVESRAMTMLIVTASCSPATSKMLSHASMREALPHEVALAGRVVEAEQGHDRDRRHQVDDGEAGVDEQQVAVPEPDEPLAERRLGADHGRRRGRHQTPPAVSCSVPSRRA